MARCFVQWHQRFGCSLAIGLLFFGVVSMFGCAVPSSVRSGAGSGSERSMSQGVRSAPARLHSIRACGKLF